MWKMTKCCNQNRFVNITSEKGEVNVQVRSLSVKELHILNKKPELLHKPKQILNALLKPLLMIMAKIRRIRTILMRLL